MEQEEITKWMEEVLRLVLIAEPGKDGLPAANEIEDRTHERNIRSVHAASCPSRLGLLRRRVGATDGPPAGGAAGIGRGVVPPGSRRATVNLPQDTGHAQDGDICRVSRRMEFVGRCAADLPFLAREIRPLVGFPGSTGMRTVIGYESAFGIIIARRRGGCIRETSEKNRKGLR